MSWSVASASCSAPSSPSLICSGQGQFLRIGPSIHGAMTDITLENSATTPISLGTTPRGANPLPQPLVGTDAPPRPRWLLKAALATSSPPCTRHPTLHRRPRSRRRTARPALLTSMPSRRCLCRRVGLRSSKPPSWAEHRSPVVHRSRMVNSLSSNAFVRVPCSFEVADSLAVEWYPRHLNVLELFSWLYAR